MVRESDWFKCYKQGWGQDLIPEAYSHPAKVNRGLTRRIYTYAIERGWLESGDICLDPFAGICGFALDAMFHGLHFIGCELEDKFVQLGQQNIDLWNKRYNRMPRWGTAVILQGDSRRLCEVLKGAKAEGIIASPPWEQSGVNLGDVADTPGIRQEISDRSHKRPNAYGTSPAQLGNMPTGEPPSAIVSSPPFSPDQPCASQTQALKDYHAFTRGDGTKRDHVMRSEGQLGAMREGDVDAVIASPPYHQSVERWGKQPNEMMRTKSLHARYGDSDGQLAALPEGEPPQVDGIVASPPFLDQGRDDKRFGGGLRDKSIIKASKLGGGGLTDYGNAEGQLGQMKEGEPPAGIVQVDACVSSPPWESSSACEDPNYRTDRQASGDPLYNDYGGHPNQLGNQQGETFWSAARAILLQCHAVLAPGGVAIFVTKRFVRDKKIVEFSQQWADLCQSCGFELIEWIKAWLVEERGTKLEMFTADTSATMHKLNGESEEIEGENFEEGRERKKVVKRFSFFRRLHAQKYPHLAIEWEDVLIFRKAREKAS